MADDERDEDEAEGSAGVREPRKPKPSLDSSGAAVELPTYREDEAEAIAVGAR